MASEIPSLGQDAPLHLKTISNLVVAKGDPFPSSFLPNGTRILVQPGTGGASDLFWNNGGAIQGLKPESTGPLGNLSGENVSITIGGTPRSAVVRIFPIDLVGAIGKVWVGIIIAEDPGKINTPTTGTFIAQDSSGGDGELGFVKST